MRGAASAAALLAIGVLAGGVAWEGAGRLAARHDDVPVAERPVESARADVASRADPTHAHRGKPNREAAARPHIRVGEK